MTPYTNVNLIQGFDIQNTNSHYNIKAACMCFTITDPGSEHLPLFKAILRYSLGLVRLGY